MNYAKNKIIENLTKKTHENPTYENEIKLLNTQTRYKNKETNENHLESLKKIKEKYGKPDKYRASSEELNELFEIVLETGVNGTNAIREYAKKYGKSKKWIDEVARGQHKKQLVKILEAKKENHIIEQMIKFKFYDKKEIFNKTLTGALTKLSKQLEAFEAFKEKNKTIESLNKDLELKENLSKNNKKDWKVAQQLRNEGKTTREIANIIGVSASAVSKYTKKPDNYEGVGI